MRSQTMDEIESLHAKIASLIEEEKRHHDAANPNENSLWRHINHTRIEFAAHSPSYRAAMQEQTP